jgi:hypothetical protein
VTNVIHLGYEVGTGEPVEIPLRHTAVTGQTQESGKTTTLEAMAVRSGLDIVAPLTKRGEGSFLLKHEIPAYFRQPAITDATPMWKWVASILEATQGEKMGKERAAIIQASHGCRTLEEVHANIKKFLHGERTTVQKPVGKRGKVKLEEKWARKPATGFMKDMYVCLDAYFQIVLPQIAAMDFSDTLELRPGVNVQDLTEESDEIQMLIVRSDIECIYRDRKNTGIIVPEAAKLLPLRRNTPVRLASEMLTRQGLALGNFLWLDTQDLANVATETLKSMGVWLIGKQAERNEVKRVIDYIPVAPPVRMVDIQKLRKGQFYVVSGGEARKVYVQPAWMTAAHAEAIARGEEEVDSARDILKEYAHEHKKETPKSTRVTGMGLQSLPEGMPSIGADVRNDGQGERSSAFNRSAETDSSSEDEAMWKEKYEELKADFDNLQSRYDLLARRIESVAAAPAVISGDMGEWFKKFPKESLEATYQYVRKRMREENPEDLLVGISKQEIRVKTERPVMNVDANGSLFGRICQLTAEGFFKQPQGAKAATAEAVRRGWCHPKTPVMRIADPLDELAKMGFLTRETDGYQIVAGVKINLESGV